MVNHNSGFNSINSDVNNNQNTNDTTTLRSNVTIGSIVSYSNKLFHINIQIIFRSIGVAFIPFAIVYIKDNCIFVDILQSHYNFIYHYAIVVFLCIDIFHQHR